MMTGTPFWISSFVAVRVVVDEGRLSRVYATAEAVGDVGPRMMMVPGSQRTLNWSPDTQVATPPATLTIPFLGRSMDGNGSKLSNSKIGFATTSASSKVSLNGVLEFGPVPT